MEQSPLPIGERRAASLGVLENPLQECGARPTRRIWDVAVRAGERRRIPTEMAYAGPAVVILGETRMFGPGEAVEVGVARVVVRTGSQEER